MENTSAPRAGLAGLTLVNGLLVWAAFETGPLISGGEIRPFPALVSALAAIGCLRLSIDYLLVGAQLMEWAGSYTATGKDGTARWARARDMRRERRGKKQGPFWGAMAQGQKAPLFIDYASNAMTVAPAGSGKGIFTVIPNGFAIKDSKVFGDFKGELACILKKPLEARGEHVRILNPSGLWEEHIGKGDCYNPLDIIVDDLHRPGGLRDVPDDLRELSAQLLPEPAQTQGDNTYWREGSRRIIADAILLEVMVEEYDATLSSVALLIEDREALEHNLRWIAGLALDGTPLPEGPMPIEQTAWAQKHECGDMAEFSRLVRARAANWLALMGQGESKTFDSFISGAQQALAPFAFGRLAPAMRRSSFSMNDLKEGERPTSLFIVADASRMEAYKAYTGLIQWCAMTAIKRHAHKAGPVYFIMDEATNYKIHGLDSLLTWGRSYGLRLHLIFQDLSAFEKTYGRTALETLFSETEIKQFLPGQRSPKTLEMIARMLGEQSVMAASLSRQERRLQEQTGESARPLMSADEVRRSKHGLLLVRQAPPALMTPVSYAEIHPWRKQAGINPFHGKPFKKRIKLKL